MSEDMVYSFCCYTPLVSCPCCETEFCPDCGSKSMGEAMGDTSPRPCGVYRYSPAGRMAPSGPWEQDRCVAPREEDSRFGLCESHNRALENYNEVRSIRS